MSYGYLIATLSPAPHLEKVRRLNFFYHGEFDNHFFYTRLEESCMLTLRKGEYSTFTDQGINFMRNLESPFFFVDFLLHKRGESYLVCFYLKRMKAKEYTIISLQEQNIMQINSLYNIVA